MTCLVYWNYSTIFSWFSNSFFSLFSLFPILRIHFNWHHRTLFPRIKPFSKSTINSIAHQLKMKKKKKTYYSWYIRRRKLFISTKKGSTKIFAYYISNRIVERNSFVWKDLSSCLFSESLGLINWQYQQLAKLVSHLTCQHLHYVIPMNCSLINNPC